MSKYVYKFKLRYRDENTYIPADSDVKAKERLLQSLDEYICANDIAIKLVDCVPHDDVFEKRLINKVWENWDEMKHVDINKLCFIKGGQYV